MTDQTFSPSPENQPTSLARALSAPTVLSTSAWAAEAPRGSLRRSAAPRYLAIHHTASPNSTDYSLTHAKELARNIQQWHFARGWDDSGQQFTISRGGHALEGRTGSLAALHDGGYFIQGSHVGGHNSQAIGIECEGSYESTVPTQKLYATLVHLASYICQQYGIGTEAILAHRQFSGQTTLCCGDAFIAKLALLRKDVATTLASGHLHVSPIGSSDPGPDPDPGPGPTPPSPPPSYPLLRSGSDGEAVTRVQKLLNAAGFSVGAVDGRFGPKTKDAVEKFQGSVGTSVDGLVGPKTWGALLTRPAPGTLLRNGSAGEEVKHLQKALNATITAGLVEDGKFGPKTETAVKKYQGSRGLSADGIVGPKTWAALKGGR